MFLQDGGNGSLVEVELALPPMLQTGKPASGV
jgi:hypothetical protein